MLASFHSSLNQYINLKKSYSLNLDPRNNLESVLVEKNKIVQTNKNPKLILTSFL